MDRITQDASLQAKIVQAIRVLFSPAVYQEIMQENAAEEAAFLARKDTPAQDATQYQEG